MAGPSVLEAPGVRAAEVWVLEQVARLRRAARDDPALLAEPVRLVVPSTSLRDHLAATLVRRCGSQAGVEVTTLGRIALELAGETSWQIASAGLFEILIQRRARREAVLRELLDELDGGYRCVATTAHELLDAGLEAVHAEPLDEFLRGEAHLLGTPAEVERARALIRVATAVLGDLEALGRPHRSAVLRAAADALAAGGPARLRCRALFVLGFGAASGAASDLLEAVLRTTGGTLVLDRPPSPDGGGFETAHTERLALRLSQLARLEPLASAPTASPPLTSHPPVLFSAPDPDAELRQIARRIRELLDAGTRPESIGVVGRQLVGGRCGVRRQLRALGVAFSGVGARGPHDRAGRDLAALGELLRRGGELHLERWLDLCRQGGPAGLRSALFNQGASRLADTVRLEADAPPPAVDGEGWATAVRAAGRLAGELEGWREGGPRSFTEHAAILTRIVDEHLAWPAAGDARQRLDQALDAPGLPGSLPLTPDELVIALTPTLTAVSHPPLGGRGGGVQVLSAREARGRTFEHLFVFGLARGVFPPPLREDALLGDALRRGLGRLLPDLPVRSASHDEDRHLFAELLSAAPRPTCSWHETDADGQATAPSPLLEGLRSQLAVERAPSILAASSAPRSVFEELLISGVHAERSHFARLLALALPSSLARSRLAVLEELDPDRSRREGRRLGHRPGPYLGFIGPLTGGADPRGADLWVTTLERFSGCPWQSFLRQILRLEPLRDPLAALPSLRGLLVGRVVHQVLERIGRRRLEARDTPTTCTAWPDPEILEADLREEAQGVLDAAGLGFKGLARAAAEQARPYLEAARRLDAQDVATTLIGVEAAGEALVEDRSGRRRRLRFRCDRIDLAGSARRYTDFKTGAHPGKGRADRQVLRDGVRQGNRLQAAAYVFQDRRAVSRYAYLRPDLEASQRELVAEGSDPQLHEAFVASVQRLLAGWDAGVFAPRLVLPDGEVEPPRCRSCQVSQACLRRDSGARGRLRRLAERLRQESAEPGTAERIFLELWDEPD